MTEIPYTNVPFGAQELLQGEQYTGSKATYFQCGGVCLKQDTQAWKGGNLGGVGLDFAYFCL